MTGRSRTEGSGREIVEGTGCMILRVTEARYERDYIIHVTFNDGAEGFVDVAGRLHGPMFEPLRDVERFKAFRVAPELQTVV